MTVQSNFTKWLALERTQQADCFKTNFNEQHIGNPMIRSLHGGVIASMVEHCTRQVVQDQNGDAAIVSVVSSSLDYLRATHDADLYCQVEEVRIARRVAFVDAILWQDDASKPVARGSCVLRIRQAG